MTLKLRIKLFFRIEITGGADFEMLVPREELFLWRNNMPENDFPEYEDPKVLFCKFCDHDSHIERRQCGPHLGAFCIHCTKKIQHLKKLKNLNRRPAKDYKHLVKDKCSRGYAFCSICYRTRDFIIQKTQVDLEVHHLREVQHDGTEDPENLILVCQDCHNIIHSIRMITHRNLNSWKK